MQTKQNTFEGGGQNGDGKGKENPRWRRLFAEFNRLDRQKIEEEIFNGRGWGGSAGGKINFRV